jgi:hypothetical protein
MSRKPYPTKILQISENVLTAWKQINTNPIGDLTQAKVETDIAEATPLQGEINALKVQMTTLRNQRNALYSELWDDVKRIRSGIKGEYGDDSSEYQIVGGTPISGRKPATRKIPA